MRSLIAIVGVLLLIAAVAKASPNPVRWLLFWWKLRRWLVFIGFAALVFAAVDSRHGGT